MSTRVSRTAQERSEHDKIILEMRENRIGCAVIADTLDIPVHLVWQTLARLDASGKHRARTYRRKAYSRSLRHLVQEHGSVTIEAGLNGGYVVTVGDKYSGSECSDLPPAVRSAMKEIRQDGE